MASTYTPIATYTVSGSAVASYTFSSIPSTYTDLILVSSVRSTDNNDGDDLKGTFNSDTGTNYSWTQIYGDGSSAASNRGSNSAFMKIGIYAGNSTAAGTFSSCVTHIQNYANTTTYKTNLVRRDIATAYTVAVVNMWRSTSAINSITLSCAVGNIAVGSTFTLYGIASA